MNVVGDGAYGQEVRVNLRGFNSGFSTQRTLVLLDGRPLTDEYLGNTDLVQYPLNSIDRIEVVRGGISAAWGTSALGGVVNLVPRRGGAVPQTTISTDGGSHNTYEGDLSHGQQIGQADLFASLGASTTDGYRRNAAGDRVDWNSRNGLINLGVQMGQASVRNIFNVYHGDGNDDQFRRRLTRVGEDVGLRLGSAVDDGGETQFRVYLDHLDQDLAWYGAPKVAYGQTGVGGFATHSRSLGAKQRILVGAEFRWNDARVTEFAGVVDRTETIAAGFLQDEIRMGRVGLLLGIRADRGGEGEFSLSYRAGVLVDVSPRTTLRAGVARAFRAPTISDRFLPPTPFGPVIFVGNPNLKPETAVSAEVGILQRAGMATLEVTGYAIRSDGFWDFIADTGAVFRAKNITRVPIYGVEATVRAALLPTVLATLGYAFNDARYDRFTGNTAVEGNYVDDNVKHSGSASLTWATARGHTLWTAAQFVGRRYTDPENTAAGRLDGYVLVGAGASLRVAGPITLRIRGENLLDKRYRTRPEFRQVGRTVSTGLAATF